MGEMIKSYDGTELFFNKEVKSEDKAVAVIVHGLCEHQGRYDYLAELFHKNAIGTYRFDHRGHGRSAGEKSHYDDFNEIIDDTNFIVDLAISENPGRPVFLVGHSMGGFAVANFGIKYPGKKLTGIITSGALTKDTINLIKGVPKDMDPHTQLPNELGDGVCSVKEVVEWYGQDPYNNKVFTAGLCYALCAGLDWAETRKKDFAYPVLMLHGEKDGLVSVEDTYDFFKTVSSTDKQMKIYGGLFHEIFNEYCKDEVIGDAIRWIKERI